MTKIPPRALHFCETTNSGQYSNMFFLVLQDDSLLEGPSLIPIRLLQTTLYCSSCSSSWFCLASRPTALYFVFPVTSHVSTPLSSEASRSLHRPKLLRTCIIHNFLALVILRRSTKDEVSLLRRGPSAPTVAPRGISLFIGNELKPRTKLPAEA